MSVPPGDEAAPPVRVDVLGPLRVRVADAVVEVPGPKRRALVALLVRADGRAVPIEDLLDALWPGDLPASGRATLHSHVSRVRGHLGAAAARLEGLPGAYRLRLDGEGSGSDAARARQLLDAARASGPAEARTLLHDARSLWRGAPLAEFAGVAPLAAWAVSLEQLRRAVEEDLAVAALEAGAGDEAVDLATALVGVDPLSETPVLVLMRALAATGRAADALRAGHEHRRRLADETGLDPSDALGDLEREIAAGARLRAGRPPRPITSLHGRDSELAAAHRLLEHERLVTLLGPGGVGKTRLAIELAARADQATALLLAPLTDGESIPYALADALELRVVHGDVLAACTALLAAGPQLLLVDNCEHLLPGVRAVVTTLLDACPGLTILATSREPLGLGAEQRLRVAPLPLNRPQGPEDLARSPAAAVFVDRARKVRPDFSPGPEEVAVMDEIIRRLDGMPLAIELAASRLGSLELNDLHARLDRSLDVLGDGRLTLRQTLEWSYDLLPEPEQRLFRHLGAFPDGFDLPTAEAVGDELGLGADLVGSVAHLVDASMVEVVRGAPARYRMLDTMRSYARDRLVACGEDDAATELFLRWAVEFARWVDETIATNDEPLADRRLRVELPNLRAAWLQCREDGRLDDAVRICMGLADAAGWRDLPEVWAWPLDLTEDPALDAHPEAGAVLGLAAGFAWSRGEVDRADRLARAGLKVGTGEQACLAALSMIALSRGDLGGAVEHGTAAADLATRPDQCLGVAALAAAYRGDVERASELVERLFAGATSPTVSGFGSYVAAEIDALAGRREAAEAHYQRAIEQTRMSGATFVDGIASVGLVSLRARSGRVADALDGYGELIDYWERTGGWGQQWTTLRNLAQLLRSLGDHETAGFLEAAALAAPDAPAVGGDDEAPDVGKHQVGSAPSSRTRVLEVAREAIDRHRSPVST